MKTCSTKGCDEEGGITWPLIAGEPSLCSHHHNHPTAQFADLVAASNAPPDDFDIPVSLWPDEVVMPRWLTAARDTWVTKEGQVIPITQLEDRHLYNIHRMLLRIEASIGEMDKEGHPTDPGPPIELFDRKQEAIIAELDRRLIPYD